MCNAQLSEIGNERIKNIKTFICLFVTGCLLNNLWFSSGSLTAHLMEILHPTAACPTQLCANRTNICIVQFLQEKLSLAWLFFWNQTVSNEYYICNLVAAYFNDMRPIFGSCFTQRPSSPPTLARQKTEASTRARQQFWVFSVKSKSFSKMLYFDLGAIFLWSFILGIKLDLSSE